MALPKTPKQCMIKIASLKKQVTAMEQRKKKLSADVKKPAKKKAVKKVVKKAVKKKPARKKR